MAGSKEGSATRVPTTLANAVGIGGDIGATLGARHRKCPGATWSRDPTETFNCRRQSDHRAVSNLQNHRGRSKHQVSYVEAPDCVKTP